MASYVFYKGKIVRLSRGGIDEARGLLVVASRRVTERDAALPACCICSLSVMISEKRTAAHSARLWAINLPRKYDSAEHIFSHSSLLSSSLPYSLSLSLLRLILLFGNLRNIEVRQESFCETRYHLFAFHISVYFVCSTSVRVDHLLNNVK